MTPQMPGDPRTETLPTVMHVAMMVLALALVMTLAGWTTHDQMADAPRATDVTIADAQPMDQYEIDFE